MTRPSTTSSEVQNLKSLKRTSDCLTMSEDFLKPRKPLLHRLLRSRLQGRQRSALAFPSAALPEASERGLGGDVETWSGHVQ
jgi:hypothetical protein